MTNAVERKGEQSMQEKIKEIQKLLNEISNNVSCNSVCNDYGKCFKLCLVQDLINKGLTYNSEIKDVIEPNRKFFAFTTSNIFNEEEILDNCKKMSKSIMERLQDEDINITNYEFSIPKFEPLIDKDSLKTLYRGMFTWRKKGEFNG